MRNTQARLLAALCVALAASVIWVAAPRRADAQRPTGIDTYAITGARIVTVSGPTIERGTVVVRNGLIAAVGQGVAAPPDARTIDGAGLTVYPGLFDASTTLGIPRPTPTPGASPAAGGGGGLAGLFGQSAPSAVSPNSTQLPGLQPEISAADIIRPGGNEIEAARNAGVTAAQTAPRGNVFLGQSAVINLSGETPQQMIVRAPVALHVGTTPIGGGQYPGSLMGVFSAVRQLLLDAQRYREANAVYERSPRGLRRPEQDKSLEALLPVLARQMPVVMQAEREREIARALDLAREFNFQLIIAGGTEAHKVAERLKSANVPVLLSLNFPKRTAAQSPDADPEPLRTLRERVEAPKTAGRLAAAGVRFAFQSGGMTQMNDYLANAARAVEQGLARDEAVRALTIRPAEILGVSQQLGTIEVGKIANLTVTRGDLFAKDRRIAHVLIDGRPVELKPAATSTGAPTATGNWTLNVNLAGSGEAQSEFTITLNLQQQGETLTGSIQGPLGSGQIGAGSITGTELRFNVAVTLPGPASQTTDAIFTGTITGNEMRGQVQLVGRGSGTFTGTRPAPVEGTPGPRGPRQPGGPGRTPADISGTYNVEFSTGPRTIPATLTLRQQGATLTGSLSSEFGTTEIANGTVGPEGFRFDTTVTLAQTINVSVSGTVNGNQISGTLTLPNGPAAFTGTRVP
ncbi:MAG: amidohydrolase family protein [Acidobacteria bacterium]|nr:amidohydrolase family protein [Acidobacteriota bacterium]